MDENKLVQLYKLVKKQTPPVNNVDSVKQLGSDLQTNPIVERMLLCTLNKKKDKFKIKDLFR